MEKYRIMKKHFITFTLLIAMALTACAQQKKTGSRKSKAVQTAISSISMSRGACFGRCPSYTLTIEENGKAAYQGRTFAPFQGFYEKQFSRNEVAGLFREFSKYRVDTCKNEYTVIIADMPGLDYNLVINGKEKTVHNANFGPEFLSDLSRLVDKTVKIDSSWKKIADLTDQ